MLYVRDPDDQEQAELKRMTRQAIGRVSQRAQMVLLSAQGRAVPELAAIFAMHPASVRMWLRRFDRHGPPGLYDAPRRGRPRLVDADVDQTIVGLIRTDPATVIGSSEATFWTVALLTLALIMRLGHSLSPATVRGALHRLGLRWRRPRLRMPPTTDPRKAEQQWAIAAAVLAAGPNTAVRYAAESRVQTLPLVRAMWPWVGQQLRIPTPGSHVTRAIFGALEIRTGQWTDLVRPRMRAEDFIAFLEHLLVVYAQRPTILIIDNYSSHTAEAVRTWLQAHPQIPVFPLPKYCSQLNPVERIWLRMKNWIAANRLYGSIKVLLASVDDFFAAMTPAQALCRAAEEK